VFPDSTTIEDRFEQSINESYQIKETELGIVIEVSPEQP
jgi:hypothetical protein